MNRGKVQVLYNCPHFLLVNKPSGVLSQPPDYHTHNKAHVLGLMDDAEDLKLVHRLDTNVTGGMVIAKTKNAAKNFHKNLLSKGSNQGYVLHRRYLALLHDPIGKLLTVPRTGKFATKVDNKLSETNYCQIDLSFDSNLLHWSQTRNLSLLALELITGRKHQIRQQLQECLQMACVNDIKYGSELIIPGTRQIALHSAWVGTKIGLKTNSFVIPVPEGGDTVWNKFVNVEDGMWLPGITSQLLKFQ